MTNSRTRIRLRWPEGITAMKPAEQDLGTAELVDDKLAVPGESGDRQRGQGAQLRPCERRALNLRLPHLFLLRTRNRAAAVAAPVLAANCPDSLALR
jgi:hypothetical protein